MFAVPAAEATAPEGADGRIFFSRDRDPGPATEYDLHSINPNGTGLVNLTPGTDTNERGAGVDPTGRWVAFSAGGVNGDIFLIGSTGGAPLTVVSGPDSEFSPTFSPDGSRIAFVRDTGPGLALETDIWLVNRDGSGLVNLTNTVDVEETDPDFSPDGRRIVFGVLTAPSETDIQSIAVNGSDRRPVVSGPTDDEQPAYSPDGRRIAFTRSPMDQIHLAAADGSGVANLMPAWLQEAFSGSWSGNAERIVFDDDSIDLFTISSVGGAVTPLTSDSQSDNSPDWEHVFRCAGRRATIVGDDGPDKINGTKKADVIVANAGRDTIRGRGGNDRICGGRAKDLLLGGAGKDRLFGQSGRDKLIGGPKVDRLRGGKGRDAERQ